MEIKLDDIVSSLRSLAIDERKTKANTYHPTKRSLIYWDKPALESFMEKHHLNLSSRVRREVTHKLHHGTKN